MKAPELPPELREGPAVSATAARQVAQKCEREAARKTAPSVADLPRLSRERERELMDKLVVRPGIISNAPMTEPPDTLRQQKWPLTFNGSFTKNCAQCEEAAAAVRWMECFRSSDRSEVVRRKCICGADEELRIWLP